MIRSFHLPASCDVTHHTLPSNQRKSRAEPTREFIRTVTAMMPNNQMECLDLEASKEMEQQQDQREASTVAYLPEEIILNILIRLHVTSVLQFKLVCKAWLKILQNPLLPALHSSHMGKNDPGLVLHCDCPVQNQLFSFELSSLNGDNQVVQKIQAPVLPEFNVVGSCEGLLCLYDSSTKKNVYLYNPFTRDYMELPKSKRFLNNRGVVFGFGFHSTTNEYKVVRIDRGNAISEVQIFTLGCSQGWRSIGRVSYHMVQGPPQVFLNGRLHWCTWPRQRGLSRQIISFDIVDEKFRVVAKPEKLDGIHFDLVNLGGCLSAVVPCSPGIEIWVMKEYNVKASWIMEYDIGIHVPVGVEHDLSQPLRGSKFFRNRMWSEALLPIALSKQTQWPPLRVLCLLKNRDILMEYSCRALVTYNPRNRTFKKHFPRGMPSWFEASIHEGSLNWIDTSTELYK